MKRDSLVDLLGYAAFSFLGPLIRAMPLSLSFFLGRRLGDIFYYFDLRHRAVAYANIKRALGDRLITPGQVSAVARRFYQSFGQNLIEIFLIPVIDKDYFRKHLTIEGLENVREALGKGKGVIFLAVHAGSWELSNIICSRLEIPFNFFVRDQRYPRLNRLLNYYRIRHGMNVIQRQNQLRQLVEVLKRNETVGMTLDQGGRSGILAEFFGRSASMAAGAVKIALKYDTALIPVFYVRLRGPFIRVIFSKPFELKKSADQEKDLFGNVQELVHIFEEYIRAYPQEYLWSYKIWKYSDKRSILVLNDGKAGHLRQSEAAARIAQERFRERGISAEITVQEVRFSSPMAKLCFRTGSLFSGKYSCQGCLWCLKKFLAKDTYGSLFQLNPDMVISCGSSLAPVNYVLARHNRAKSIVIMKPSLSCLGRFDLVIMPRHDRPPRRNNVVAIDGALSFFSDGYLEKQAQELSRQSGYYPQNGSFAVGLLLGGDSKGFSLGYDHVREVIGQLKAACLKAGLDILASTSRRTPPRIEGLVKQGLGSEPRCKFLVIANEENFSFAVGGILGRSCLIVISPESISMISEAVNSGRPVVVFDSPGLGAKHRRFLKMLSEKGFIRLVAAVEVGAAISEIRAGSVLKEKSGNNSTVREAIGRVL